ncbi:MAG: hypothetical protein JSU86_11455 [Phycisphaerales bacterium]|nr:MAG: hypothetical protein JSU86_11455 [Phycisphaerales bacterium]
MKAHIGTGQKQCLIGILGIGLLSLGAGPYGSGAGPVAAGEPAVGGVPGAVPARSGETDAAEGGVWEAYAGMIAAATCLPSSPPEPERLALPGDPISQKVRYLSLIAGDAGQSQAIRVTFDDLPAPYDSWNGVQMWVQEPTTYCENAGVVSPPCPPAQPTSDFTGATLGCDPWYGDFYSLTHGRCDTGTPNEGEDCDEDADCGEPPSTGDCVQDAIGEAVHVYHEGIVPDGIYVLQIVDATCNLVEESSYSEPLCMYQSAWGDVVGNCVTYPCGPPDGVASLTDYAAVLDKFTNTTIPHPAIIKVRADLDWETPNRRIDISDATFCFDAFGGVQYPPPGFSPPGSPPCTVSRLSGASDTLAGPRGLCPPFPVCGDEFVELPEECDHGGESMTCDANCTYVVCGDGIVNTTAGEGCDPPDGVTCDGNCQLLVTPTNPIRLVPVGNDWEGNLDPGVTLDGNEITLPRGGHKVFLEIELPDWDPDVGGVKLDIWQVAIDSTGYTSGLQGTLTPWAPSCTTDPDCEALMGPLGTGAAAMGGCGATGVPSGLCAAGFIDNTRTDYIFSGQGELPAVDRSTLDYRYGSTLLGAPIPSPGIAGLYGGTLAVDVPIGAAGTFIIDFRHGAEQTYLASHFEYLIPLGGFEPAVITVLTACCLPDGSCDPAMTVEDCLNADGALVAECAGDNDSNGINDACESGGCCLDGGTTCVELSRVDCKAQGGAFVCACLGDVDPVYGVDDACEPCANASTPLAEPMACSQHDHCGEQPPGEGRGGTCSVDGTCVCVDNDDCWNLAECLGGVCYAPKNRYITFEPNNAGRCVALRVDMTSCGTFPGCTFTKKWVDEPNPVTGVSRVVDTPIYRDWTEEVIYVGDLEIVPASTYEVRAIQQDCDPNDPTKYSSPLILPTVPIPTTCADSCVAPCSWADIVGIQVSPGVYLPPDGNLDFDDVVAMMDAVTEHPTAPPISWTDLMREVPNGRIGIRDLIAVDDACFSDDPYFADYPGASPCGTPSVDQPSEGAEEPRTTDPVLECRLYDLYGNHLTKDPAGSYQAMPSETVDTEMFLKDVLELRAYTVGLDPARNGETVADWIHCPEGADVDPWHRACVGTREKDCTPGSLCKWCEGGSNNELPCTDNQDCPDDGTCVDGPRICVGGDDHGISCVDSSDCEGGQGCKACAEDFVFFAATNRFADSVCGGEWFEILGRGDPTDLVGDTPPAYLGTYTLDIPGDVAGRTFNIDIMPNNNRDEEPQETTFFLTTLETANDPSIYFEYRRPCARLNVLYDCNGNAMPDQCDIGDQTTCASALCQRYIGPGRPECGQSDDCNDNGYPDECEIAEDPVYHPGEFFCPVDCICSVSKEPCPEDCDCHTGDGCPVGCEPECVPVAFCAQDCQPDGEPGHGIPDACDIAECAGEPDFCDCNNNDVPDRCDILGGASGDNGLCDSEERDCSWDCQPNGVPDECELNCSDDDACPDECEGLVDRAYQGCGGGMPEQDCDTDGICNACEIDALGLGKRCVTFCQGHEAECGNSPDCQPNEVPDECDLDPSDPDGDGSFSPDCQPNVIPDECDIACADDSQCTDDCKGNPCCRDCQPQDEPGHGIPDGCDIRDCDGDITCRDWNYNGVPDACDIPRVLSNEYYCAAGSCTDGTVCVEDSDCEGHGWPWTCSGDGVPADCSSCDANANGFPDEYECPGASQSGACENAFEDDPAESTFTIQAALAIQLVDENDADFAGLAFPFTGLSGSATIWRGTPHFHGDPEDTPGDQPCLVPPGFPEPLADDFARSREVHLEMTDLTLSGPDVSLSLRGSTLGEAQGTCIDFPADVFFTLYVQATIGTVELHNETPIVLRAELSDFEGDYWWDYTRSTTGQRRSVMVNDHSAPAIPMMDDSGRQRAYLTRIQLGQGTFAPVSGSCEAAPAIDGPVSFIVDGGTTGVVIGSPNEVYEDRGLSAKRVRAYVSSGATPSAPPDTTNVRDTTLTGNTIPPDGFSGDDRIKSLSFGQDGTRDPTAEGLSPILYFSVDGLSLGVDCTDVRSEGVRQGTAAADVFVSPMPTFGNYAESPGVLPSACDTTRGNCLAADNTALGLGPHAAAGVADNVVGLELGGFDVGDLAYLTFLAPSFGGDSATIWVYDNQGDPGTYPFEPGYLLSYANAGNLGLQAGADTIDALVVSDVTPGTKVCAGDQSSCTNDGDCVDHGMPEICTDVPDGVWNTGDEVLFSLAPGSQTLTDHGWSGAHIFKVSEGQTGLITAANVFLEPAALGLEASTDDVDAIDVGAGKAFDDCNRNAIDDSCDIARGFSADDIGPLDDVPDECQTACTIESTAPEPERLAIPGNPISQKNRYISFTPSEEEGKAGRRQAIRVTFEDLAAPFAGFNGESMWVGEPDTYCENGGEKTPPCSPAQPSNEFLGATLECEPYFRDWHGVCSCGWCRGGFEEGKACSDDSDCATSTIHVYHELIIPGSIYRIDVIDQRCLDLSNELSYSEPDLEATTSVWGDVMRNCSTNPCGAPDGIVGIPTDVTAVLEKFKNLVPPSVPYVAITKARADLDWATPNQRVDISDVTCCLDAFRGVEYPPVAFYDEGPPEPPWCDGGASGR